MKLTHHLLVDPETGKKTILTNVGFDTLKRLNPKDYKKKKYIGRCDENGNTQAPPPPGVQQGKEESMADIMGTDSNNQEASASYQEFLAWKNKFAANEGETHSDDTLKNLPPPPQPDALKKAEEEAHGGNGNTQGTDNTANAANNEPEKQFGVTKKLVKVDSANRQELEAKGAVFFGTEEECDKYISANAGAKKQKADGKQ